MRSIQYIPRATEKAYSAQARHEYIFFVPMSASKQEIAKQIAAAFDVTVVDVRVATRKGKQTKYSKGKHAYPGVTYRRDHKVAYITLKDGDKIPVFQEAADATTDKKADTKSDKDAKKAAKSEEKPAKKTTTRKVAKKAEKEDK